MSCGIYLLKFNNFDKVYIGKSVDISSRTKRHIKYLQSKTHYNYKVQAAYDKYGIPEIITLEEAPFNTLNTREVYWIAKYDSYKNGLNGTAGGDGGSLGEDNVRAKYDKDTYVLILELLANSDWTILEIVNELDVSYDVVCHISSGYSHKYLKEEYPEAYLKMLTKHRMSSICKYPKDTYIKILEMLANSLHTQQEIANILNVSLSVVINISAGATHRYLEEEYPELYSKMRNKKVRQVLSPEGKVFTIVKAKDFAEEHNLSRGALSQVLNGKLKQHKGWTLA